LYVQKRLEAFFPREDISMHIDGRVKHRVLFSIAALGRTGAASRSRVGGE
jgi:hypothetical protein